MGRCLAAWEACLVRSLACKFKFVCTWLRQATMTMPVYYVYMSSEWGQQQGINIETSTHVMAVLVYYWLRDKSREEPQNSKACFSDKILDLCIRTFCIAGNALCECPLRIFEPLHVGWCSRIGLSNFSFELGFLSNNISSFPAGLLFAYAFCTKMRASALVRSQSTRPPTCYLSSVTNDVKHWVGDVYVHALWLMTTFFVRDFAAVNRVEILERDVE